MFDIWDTATNTETINRAIETVREAEPFIGETLAPLVNVQDRRLKLGRWQIAAFGKGQFKARGATPPIFMPKIRFDEQMIELANLDEMTPIEEDEWEDLTSTNEDTRNRAGVAILSRARMLQLRNERLTEWMRWQAFQDNLQIDIADQQGQNYKLVYGMPATNKPVAGIAWLNNRATSTPITNLRAWQKLGRTAFSRYFDRIYMSTNTYEELEYSTETRNLLFPGTNREFVIPPRDAIQGMLYTDAAGNAPQIVITDAGIRDESAGYERGDTGFTQFIPDGYVMLTMSGGQVDGERIADVANGRVAITTNGGPPLQFQMGPQSETMYDLQAKTHFWRQASVRIPRVHVPEGFVWARAY